LRTHVHVLAQESQRLGVREILPPEAVTEEVVLG
jgi:hypothetical protein